MFLQLPKNHLGSSNFLFGVTMSTEAGVTIHSQSWGPATMHKPLCKIPSVRYCLWWMVCYTALGPQKVWGVSWGSFTVCLQCPAQPQVYFGC